MLRDIRVWWNDYGVDDIFIEEDPTGTFKTDGELDKVVGYFAEFRFQIPSHGRCDVPINVTPQPPVSGCLPANYVVEYADGTPIQSGEIPSGQSETIVVPNCEPCPPCENATYILTVGGNAVDSGEIGSGQTEEIPIDAFIPACEDATVQINGDQVATVASGGMVNIAVENESGTPLGTFDEETGVWVIPDCQDATAVLRDTDNNILSTTPIASGATENITAPDGTVTVNRDGVFFADVDVTSGGVASVNVPSVKELFWELNYNGTDDIISIPATVNNVGTLTSGSGSNVGTIEVSTDNVTFVALTFPFTAISGTTYFFKRSTATVSGTYTMTGSYV
jgi:hypothetical protein